MRKVVSLFAVVLIEFACKKTETAAVSTTITETTSITETAAPTPQPAATTAPTASATPTTGSIASTDGEKSGAHIDVTELKRTSGGTVNLKFAISNSGSERLALSSGYLGDSNVSRDYYRDISGIHLLDPVNKKKYFVVTDADKHCVCSKDIPDVEPGAKLNLWARFPAPPPEVTKVTIEIPHLLRSMI